MASNKFNTAPNGTTVVDVNSVIGLPTTLIVDPVTTPYIDGIIALNPTITTFVFKAGVYKLVSIMLIRKNGIKFVGMTGVAKDVQIVQTMNTDGVVIRADSILLQDISIKCTFSGKICLTGASMSNSVISGCYIYGASDTFTMYLAGPSSLAEGASTLNGYTQYNLDTGNCIYGNVFYSNFSGDSVAFCLQYKSHFASNLVRGGKVAVYMCRVCNIYANIINDSTTNGIYCSFPSDRLSIIGNKINNPTYSGIVMKNQLEHGPFTPYDYNITVRNNYLFGSKGSGIELNNAINVSLIGNKIISGQTIGVYSYSGKKVTIQSNKIAYFKFGIFLENSTDTTVLTNNMISVFPALSDNAIKIYSNTSTTTVSDNNLKGMYRYNLIVNSGPNNTIQTNPIQQFYTISEEKNLYNVI
jgi:parallel beta-helix repeat protein